MNIAVLTNFHYQFIKHLRNRPTDFFSLYIIMLIFHVHAYMLIFHVRSKETRILHNTHKISINVKFKEKEEVQANMNIIRIKCVIV